MENTKNIDVELGAHEDSVRNLPELLGSIELESASSLTPSPHPVNGGITFRPLQVEDRTQIQALHEECFPVTYKDIFYDGIVQNKCFFNSHQKLFSCVAIHHEAATLEREEGWRNPLVSELEIDPDSTGRIVSCIVGTFLSVTRLADVANLLITNHKRHTHMFYIMTLGTVDDFRHSGLGTTMVKHCITLVERNPKCGVLYLHVIISNFAAIRFYERLGFFRIKEIENYYTIQDNHYNCYLYAKYFHGNWGHWSILNITSSIVSTIRNKFIPRETFTKKIKDQQRTLKQSHDQWSPTNALRHK